MIKKGFKNTAFASMQITQTMLFITNMIVVAIVSLSGTRFPSLASDLYLQSKIYLTFRRNSIWIRYKYIAIETATA